ncbi:MAG: ATP-binding cassette domain-containing protein [Deltaproteobacteria bacterium]|jgi:phospholipid/cholesterol/gamma-HCH transport system ATP-binding protein|nr:ATP-binding cassette domain-containing protein [Deltaproteobacteria bacterium]
MAAPTIVVYNLKKSFGDQEVLKGITFKILPGCINFLIGRSGEGKSVVLKHLTGLMRADSGEIWFDNLELSAAHPRDLQALRLQMGLLFQDGALFDSLSVGENVAFPLWFHRITTVKKAQAKAEQLLEELGLAGAGPRKVVSLSTGERKRVALARALVMEPAILFFDEPTTGLDPLLSGQVDELIGHVQKRSGATVVVISHDIAATLTLADQVSMIYDGQIIASAPPQVFKVDPNPEIQKFLAGEPAS